MRKSNLGRGLDALIPSDIQKDDGLTLIAIEKIKPNKSQPRKNFDEKSISELANSIKEKGLIQPLIVRKLGKDYEIIAGERRWRAAQKSGLKDVPVIVKDVKENELIELALIENLQREDLNPIEEAEAYEKLITDFGLTHEQISNRIGRDRSTISNQIRLLKLTYEAKSAIIKGNISAGHARALLSLEDPEEINQLLNTIIKKKLSVRQAEQLVKLGIQDKRKALTLSTKKSQPIDKFLYNVEDELKKSLRTKVKINGKADKGRIEIEYYSKEELDRLIGILTSNG